MVNLEREIALMQVGATFLEMLQERLDGRTSIGASTWFEDMAWGIRLFVEQKLPFFGGGNAASWLTVAEQFELRAEFYKTKMNLLVPVEEDDEASAIIVALNNIERFKRLVEFMIGLTQTEASDLSGLLPSGEKGITVGEAVKLSRQFTAKFWNYSYNMSSKNPNKPWLKAVVDDLMTAQQTLGEPMHAGDLGGPGTGGTGPFPWSMPGQ